MINAEILQDKYINLALEIVGINYYDVHWVSELKITNIKWI